MTGVCETKKILPRISNIMVGKTLLISREIDKIDLPNCDYIKFDESPDGEEDNKKENYDLVLAIIFTDNVLHMNVESLEFMLDYVKPNGLMYMYFPHKHYCMDPNVETVIPHDILLESKHIQRHQFEVVDVQTFKDQEPYGSKPLDSVEYAFHIVLRKSANTFGKKDLSDDPGQLVSLDD